MIACSTPATSMSSSGSSSAGVGLGESTVELGDGVEPDLGEQDEEEEEAAAFGFDEDEQDEDDYEEYSDDEESPAYGALPWIKTVIAIERRSPSPSAVPLRSCLKKQKSMGDEVERGRTPTIDRSRRESETSTVVADEGDEVDLEVEVEIEEYMMAGFLSEATPPAVIKKEQAIASDDMEDDSNDVDWQWRTLPFLLPTRSRSDWCPLLHHHPLPNEDDHVKPRDPLAELDGFLRNALFEHGRRSATTKSLLHKARSDSSTPSSPRSMDGILTPPIDELDTLNRIFLEASDLELSISTVVVEQMHAAAAAAAGLSKRVRFPGCPEAMGEVALCVSRGSRLLLMTLPADHDAFSSAKSLYPTWSPAEYDRSPLEPPSEEEKACKMPERGSRCLSDVEDELPAFIERCLPDAYRLSSMGTIYEADDDYPAVVLAPRATLPSQGWASWCSGDTFGGGSTCDEFGLESSSALQQETYTSWQAEDEFGSAMSVGGFAGGFTTSPTDSDGSSDEGSNGQAEDDDDDDDDCWEAWLDARKSKTAAAKQVELELCAAQASSVASADEVEMASTPISNAESNAPTASVPILNSAPPTLISTPDYGKLHDSVYEPAEDSFILLDALEVDAAELRASKPTICLEIGSGSGIASAFLSTIVDPASALFMSTDINPEACLATHATSILNRAHLNPIHTNLVSPILERLEAAGGADVLVFNPPYVPTDEDELTKTQLEAEIGATWAGGVDGMVVTNVVLDLLPRILNPNGGRIYLVAVSANQPAQIVSNMAEHGFDGEVSHVSERFPQCIRVSDRHLVSVLQIILKRRAGREMLHVIKLTRRP